MLNKSLKQQKRPPMQISSSRSLQTADQKKTSAAFLYLFSRFILAKFMAALKFMR